MDVAYRSLEVALHEDEEGFRQFFEHSPDAVLLIDPHHPSGDWIIVACNQAACTMNGYRRAELIDQPLDVLHLGPENPRQRAVYFDRLRRLGHVHGEALHRHSDGSVFPVEYSSSLIVLAGRELILGIDRDITVRKQAEAVLQRANAELEQRVTERTAALTAANERLQVELDARKRTEEDARFLAQISALLAASLDEAETLSIVSQETVPYLADYCIVDLLRSDRSLRQAAVAYVTPAKAALVRELGRRSPFDRNVPYGVSKVLHEGKAELVPELSSEVMHAAAGDDEYRRLVRELGLTSYIIVPLIARGHALGAISFFAAESGRHFDAADLRLAEELAGRVALAVDNARLYREAQAAAQRAEEARALLDALFAAAPAGLGFWDTELHYVRINNALAAINGLAPEQHLGRTVCEVRPGLGAEIAQDLRHVLQTGEPIVDREVSGETTATPGQHRHWLASYYPVRGADGGMLGIGGVVTEITGRKRTEAALRTSEQRLAGIIGSAMDAIISIDADQRILLFNAAAEHMFRTRASDVLGKSIDRFIPAAARAAHRRHIPAFGATGVTNRSMHALQPLTALRGDGDEFPIEASISQISAQGETIYSVIIRDITERMRAEHDRAVLLAREQAAREEAEAALTARDVFLSIAAHELRTPLTTLLGYAHMLERRVTSDRLLPAREQRRLGAISEQAMRLNTLLEALLDVARLQLGRFAVDCRPLDLSALVRRVVDEVEPILEQHTLTLDCPPVVSIVGDDVRLGQVLHNLLSNAIKYSPEGGPIEVRVVEHGEEIAIGVSDRGIGIPDDAQAGLFRQFYRAMNVDPKRISGLGIGLYVVHEIVKRHGGWVEVQSTEGQGSTFTVWLPRTPPAAPGSAPWSDA